MEPLIMVSEPEPLVHLRIIGSDLQETQEVLVLAHQRLFSLSGHITERSLQTLVQFQRDGLAKDRCEAFSLD